MTEEQTLPPPEETKPKKAKTLKLSPAQWHEMEKAWAEGRFASAEEMAEEFGVPKPIILEHMKAKKIRKGQAIHEYNKSVQRELEKKAKAEAKLIAERVAETRDTHYKMSEGIARSAYGELVTAQRNGLPISTAKHNLLALESAMKVIKMAREEKFAVLGIDKEGTNLDEEDVPELVVNELTADQMEEMRAQAGEFEETDSDFVTLGDEVVLGDSSDDLEDPENNDLDEQE